MEIRYLILARYAEFTPDGMVNIIGGDHNRIVADDYPYVHDIILAAVRIVFDRTDSEIEHSFRAIIVDEVPNDIVAEGPSWTIPPLVMPAEVNLLGTGMILPFEHVIFPSPGIYIVRLLVDGLMLAEARFRVAPIAYYRGLSEISPNR